MIVEEPGSYRDRRGHVFYANGNVYRSILLSGEADYKKIRDQGIIQDSIEKGFLVGTREIEKDDLKKYVSRNAEEDISYILKHEKVPFISYPYEWSFSQLKTAALHHLDFQLFLLERDAVLRDATAYNIQFINARPIFIDLLSIAPYEQGMYWHGYRQFCEQFLNPLLLYAYRNIPHFDWYRGSGGGVKTTDLSPLLPLTKKLKLSLLIHVVLHSYMENKASNNAKGIVHKINNKKPPSSKESYKQMLLQIRDTIRKLELSSRFKTVWADYAADNSYDSIQKDEKKQIVADFVKRNKPNFLIDLGCNTGDYSNHALGNGARNVLGCDFDLLAVNQASIRSRKSSLNFLPLRVDITNPSPSQGLAANGASRLTTKAQGGWSAGSCCRTSSRHWKKCITKASCGLDYEYCAQGAY